MADNDRAERLAELGIKHNRTLADLDAIQEAIRSTRRSIEAYTPQLDAQIQEHLDELERGDLSDARRTEVYRELDEAFKTGIAEFKELIAEWERLQVQERILLQMIVELDRQIEVLKREMR